MTQFINSITGLPNRLSDMREDVRIDGNLTVLGSITVLNTQPASTYSLGAASSYVILSQNTLSNGTAVLFVNNNVGYSAVTGSGLLAFSNGAAIAAPADSGATAAAITTFNQLTGLTPTFTWAGAVTLDTDTTHGSAGIFTPGIYSGGGACNTTASSTITLSGSGDFVFVFVGAITTGANTIINLTGDASASRVFWVSDAALTTGANTVFVGTALTAAAITTGANTNINGAIMTVSPLAAGNITIGAGNIIQSAH